jgi:hypothetical protein
MRNEENDGAQQAGVTINYYSYAGRLSVQFKMNGFFIVPQRSQSLTRFINHTPPAANKKLCIGLTGTALFIYGMYIAAMAFPGFAGEHRQVAESRHLVLQRTHIIKIKQVFFFATAKNKVYALIRQLMRPDMVHHAVEGRNAGAGADEKKRFVECRQGKVAEWPTQRKLRTHFGFFKKIGGSGAFRRAYNDEFDEVGTVGAAGNGVAAPALVGSLVYGQVKGYKLTRHKIKPVYAFNIDPKLFGIVRVIFYSDDGTGLPW